MMHNKRLFIVIGTAMSLLLSHAAFANFTVFEAAGENPAAITPTRDAFRASVGGGTVAGANGWRRR